MEIEQGLQELMDLGRKPNRTEGLGLRRSLALVAARVLATDHNQPYLPLDRPLDPNVVRVAYEWLGANSDARVMLLMILAMTPHPEHRQAFVDLLIASPPYEENDVGLALSSFFQRPTKDLANLFPRILDAVEHPVVAASLLDLANFLYRKGIVAPHPSLERRTEFLSMLARITDQLERIEESGPPRGVAANDQTRFVSQGVAIAVSLCHTFSLLQTPEAAPRLRRVLELRHRRLRCEAAFALCKLGDGEGKAKLIELASEPVARLRVLAYAEELNLLNEIPPEYTHEVARAEAELASWLAEPQQFAFPPSKIKLLDQRDLYWPGSESPQSCFLFRFEYPLPSDHAEIEPEPASEGPRRFANVALVGPVTHAFTTNLTLLDLNEIYAMFAGWHGTHEEIYDQSVAEFTEQQRVEVARWERKAHDMGYDDIRPALLSYFFGERSLVAHAKFGKEMGMLVVDASDESWFPIDRVKLAPLEAAFLFRGRKLLRAFNPDEEW